MVSEPSQSYDPHVSAYRADIDGLRAVAVLAVVAFHAFPSRMAGGFVGVDIFFVISGYLISSIIFRSLNEARFSFADFYARRIRRIFPALILVLLTTYGVGLFVMQSDDFRLLTIHIVRSAGFILNFRLIAEAGYFDTAADLKPLLHLWSLSIEEQFYLVWPLVVYFLWKRRINMLAVAAIFFSSFLFNVFCAQLYPTFDFFSPLTRFWELTVGCGLAWIAAARTQPLTRWHLAAGGRLADLLAFTGALMIGLSFVLIDRNRAFPGWWALLPTLGAGALIHAGRGAWINRTLLSHPLPVAIGLISYPLYLWHWPLLSFARIVEGGVPSTPLRLLLIAISFLLAVATYILVEKPIRFGSNTGVKTVALSAVTVMIGVVAFFSDIPRDWNVNAQWNVLAARQKPVLQERARSDAIVARYKTEGCTNQPWAQDRIKQGCEVYNDTAAAQGTIVLWGDSHAGTLNPVVFEIARGRHMRVVTISDAGCAPLLHVRSGNPDIPRCSRMGLAEADIQSIGDLQPTAIIVTSRWSLWVHKDLLWDGVPRPNANLITADETGPIDIDTSRRALQSQLEITVAALKRVAPTVIVKNPPVLRYTVLTGYARFSDTFEPSIEEYRAFEAFNHGVIDATAKKLNVPVVEPGKILCQTKCSAMRGDEVLYKDDNHLTAQGTMLLQHDLEQALDLAIASRR